MPATPNTVAGFFSTIQSVKKTQCDMMEKHLVTSVWESDPFTQRIIDALRLPAAHSIMVPDHYRNGEFNPTFAIAGDKTTAGGNHIYIVGTHDPNSTPQELAIRMQLAAKSAKDNGALSVTAIFPDLPYARADHSAKTRPEKMRGKSRSLEALAQALVWDVDRVITVHPHSQAVYDIFGQTYSKVHGYHVDGHAVIHAINPAKMYADYVINNDLLNSRNILLVPDDGAREMTREVAGYIGEDRIMRVLCDKSRARANDPEALTSILEDTIDFTDTTVLLIDDGADSCGTATHTFAHAKNAARRIFMATHAWLEGGYPSERAQDRLVASNIDTFVFGNTRPDREHSLRADLAERTSFIDFAQPIADAIRGYMPAEPSGAAGVPAYLAQPLQIVFEQYTT